MSITVDPDTNLFRIALPDPPDGYRLFRGVIIRAYRTDGSGGGLYYCFRCKTWINPAEYPERGELGDHVHWTYCGVCGGTLAGACWS